MINNTDKRVREDGEYDTSHVNNRHPFLVELITNLATLAGGEKVIEDYEESLINIQKCIDNHSLNKNTLQVALSAFPVHLLDTKADALFETDQYRGLEFIKKAFEKLSKITSKRQKVADPVDVDIYGDESEQDIERKRSIERSIESAESFQDWYKIIADFKQLKDNIRVDFLQNMPDDVEDEDQEEQDLQKAESFANNELKSLETSIEKGVNAIEGMSELIGHIKNIDSLDESDLKKLRCRSVETLKLACLYVGKNMDEIRNIILGDMFSLTFNMEGLISDPQNYHQQKKAENPSTTDPTAMFTLACSLGMPLSLNQGSRSFEFGIIDRKDSQKKWLRIDLNSREEEELEDQVYMIIAEEIVKDLEKEFEKLFDCDDELASQVLNVPILVDIFRKQERVNRDYANRLMKFYEKNDFVGKKVEEQAIGMIQVFCERIGLPDQISAKISEVYQVKGNREFKIEMVALKLQTIVQENRVKSDSILDGTDDIVLNLPAYIKPSENENVMHQKKSSQGQHDFCPGHEAEILEYVKVVLTNEGEKRASAIKKHIAAEPEKLIELFKKVESVEQDTEESERSYNYLREILRYKSIQELKLKESKEKTPFDSINRLFIKQCLSKESYIELVKVLFLQKTGKSKIGAFNTELERVRSSIQYIKDNWHDLSEFPEFNTSVNIILSCFSGQRGLFGEQNLAVWYKKGVKLADIANILSPLTQNKEPERSTLFEEAIYMSIRRHHNSLFERVNKFVQKQGGDSILQIVIDDHDNQALTVSPPKSSSTKTQNYLEKVAKECGLGTPYREGGLNTKAASFIPTLDQLLKDQLNEYGIKAAMRIGSEEKKIKKRQALYLLLFKLGMLDKSNTLIKGKLNRYNLGLIKGICFANEENLEEVLKNAIDPSWSYLQSKLFDSQEYRNLLAASAGCRDEQGLPNLGVTCYVNSALQVIFSLLEVQDDKLRQSGPIIESFKEIRDQWNNGRVIERQNMEDFFENLHAKDQQAFPENIQSDASEAFKKIIEYLGLDAHGLKTTTTRVNSDNSGDRIEDQVVLPIPIPNRSQEDVSLQGLIDSFQEVETILSSEESGADVESIQRQMTISTIPGKPLFFSLIRYEFDRQQGPSKNRVPVSINEELTIEGNAYQLMAIISHWGSINSGHYVAFTKSGEEWFKRNDSQIVPSNFEEVLAQNQDVYMLAYIPK